MNRGKVFSCTCLWVMISAAILSTGFLTSASVFHFLTGSYFLGTFGSIMSALCAYATLELINNIRSLTNG